MTYFLVSPYSNKNNGISNYCVFAQKLLVGAGIDAEIIGNREELRPGELERLILTRAQNEQDIVEVPDSWGLFANNDANVRLHVRLHAPSEFLQRLNGVPVNHQRWQRELGLIRKANWVSSPSLANYQAYENIGPLCSDVRIFPNPVIPGLAPYGEKDIDVVYIGRLDKVKGADYLYQLLLHLPRNLRIAVLGINEADFCRAFSFTPSENIEFYGWVSNEEKEHVLARAKVCAILSRFESYSLVAAEAITKRCHLVAWNVGGLAECFPLSTVKLVNQGDVANFSALILDALGLLSPNPDDIRQFVARNNEKYVAAVRQILSGREQNVPPTHDGYSEVAWASSFSLSQVRSTYVNNLLTSRKLKIFGFSMMNEHAEEMWGALLERHASDYRFVSRKDLGYNSKFNNKFYIDPSKFLVYDWRFQCERLLQDISSFNPDIVFVFNGNTVHFAQPIRMLREKLRVPLVFSELGWLPQNGFIYFDERGANHRSGIAQCGLESLIGRVDNHVKNAIRREVESALLVLQLPGDSTLGAEPYPLQIPHQDLVAHVRKSIPPHIKLYVRKHPRDVNEYQYEELINCEADSSESLAASFIKVDAVIGVNSTALLEALAAPVEIYHLGHGLLSNKDLAVDCTDGEILSRWRSTIEINMAPRLAFLDYLKLRQLDVAAYHRSAQPVTVAAALYPIAHSLALGNVDAFLYGDGRKPSIEKEAANQCPVHVRQNVQMVSNMQMVQTTPNRNQVAAKAKKLLRDPRRFIKDYVTKRSADSLSVRLMMKGPRVAEWILGRDLQNMLQKRRLGEQLEQEYKKIARFSRYVPKQVFLYHKTKWIYFGVTKAAVSFAKSKRALALPNDAIFDLAAMLCEAGNYSAALEKAVTCLKRDPRIFRRKQYLRLAYYTVGHQNLKELIPDYEVEFVEKLASCFKSVAGHQKEFLALVKQASKDFCVIGNSPAARGLRRGKDINTKKLVIRFNSYDTSLDRRKDIGMRTDIWVKSPSFEEVRRKDVSGLKMVVLTGTNHLDRSPSAYDFLFDFVEAGVKVCCVPPDIYSTLATKLNAPPSGGIQILYWLRDIVGPLPTVAVLGFSTELEHALQGPAGEKGQKRHYHHNWAAEIKLIRGEILKE